MPTSRITGYNPKRGRGPAHVTMEDGNELSIWDGIMSQVCYENSGAEVEYEISTQVSKSTGKSYLNLKSVKIISGGSPAEVPAVSPQTGDAFIDANFGLPPTSKPTNTQALDAKPFEFFDAADDASIVAKLRGEIAEALVYEFKDHRGKVIYGLGVDGAEACKREIAIQRGEVLRPGQVDVKFYNNDPQAAFFSVCVKRFGLKLDKQTGKTYEIELDCEWGYKRQPKIMPGGSPNTFWYEQGCSKAIRNAVLKLIPPEIKNKVIYEYKTRNSPKGQTAKLNVQDDVIVPTQALDPATIAKIEEEFGPITEKKPVPEEAFSQMEMTSPYDEGKE